jgi:hypothetical protein
MNMRTSASMRGNRYDISSRKSFITIMLHRANHTCSYLVSYAFALDDRSNPKT